MDMDPDPAFWPNLDPDPGLCYQFLKNVENSFRGKNFYRKIFFKNNKKTITMAMSSVGPLTREFLSKILHLLSLFHHIFTCVLNVRMKYRFQM